MPIAKEVEGGMIFVPTEEEEIEIARRKQVHRDEEARKETLVQAVEDIKNLQEELITLRDEVKTIVSELQEMKGES